MGRGQSLVRARLRAMGTLDLAAPSQEWWEIQGRSGPAPTPSWAELADWLLREVPEEVDEEALKRFRLLVQTAEDAGIRSGLELHPDIAIAMGDFRQEHLPTLLQRMHVLWLDLDKPEGQNPIRPIVEAWQRRPRLAQPDRKNRMLPARLAHVRPSDRRAMSTPSGNPALFTPAAHRRGQLILQGFERERKLAALPLALYDMGGDGRASNGPAPLALRLWVAAILYVGLDTRRAVNAPVSLEVTLRELRERLWPNSWRGYSTDRLRRVLWEASEDLDSWDYAWPWRDEATGRGGSRRVVLVRDIGDTLDDTLRFTVDLPPGAEAGPIVPPSLNTWGAKSAPGYRALLNLSYNWYRPGVTRIPARKRGPYFIQSQDPRRYDELDDQDLVDLVFPTSARQHRRDLLYHAKATLKTLEAAGELRIEGNRILPPR